MKIKFHFRTLLISAVSILFVSEARAEVPRSKEIERILNSAEIEQVTNVFELRDVSSGDWAFEALRSLVERYGCIEGYPDKTYRKGQALTRYEFAAGLNACMNQIERLIAASEAVLREDIEKLQRLIQEFESELAALGARVDDLEGRVAFLEDHTFSTTTILRGEAILSLNVAGGGSKAQGRRFPVRPTPDVDDEVTLGDRVRLQFNTSFTGKDTLFTRIQARNILNYYEYTGTYSARLGYDGNNDNNVELDRLWYKTPIGDRVTFHIAAEGVELADIFEPRNPYFESSGSGALSRFGRYNPLYRTSGEQALGLQLKLSQQFSVDLAYLVSAANNPTNKNGLFNGDYSAAIQLNWEPNENVGLAVTYAHSYYPGKDLQNFGLFSRTGSNEAETPFLSGSLNGSPVASSVDRFSLQGTWKLGTQFNIAGWFGAAIATAEQPFFIAPGRIGSPGEQDLILTAGINLALLDLGKQGSVLGLIFGVPPVNTDRNFYANAGDPTYLIEAQYRYPLVKNILITPGAYMVINPNQNAANETIVVGVIRTTFRF